MLGLLLRKNKSFRDSLRLSRRPRAAHRARLWRQTQSLPVPISTPRFFRGTRAAGQASGGCSSVLAHLGAHGLESVH